MTGTSHRLTLIARALLVGGWISASLAGSALASPVGLDQAPDLKPIAETTAESAAGTQDQRTPPAAAEDELLDFGEGGKLARQVDMASQRRMASRLSAPRAEPWDDRPPNPAGATQRRGQPHEPRPESARAPWSLDTNVVDADTSEAVRPAEARERSYAPANADAARVLADMASPDQRNTVREAVLFVKSMLRHPLTWVLLGVVGAVSLIFSAARRRRK